MEQKSILQAFDEIDRRFAAIEEGMIHHIGGRATVLVNPTVTGAIRWSDVSILRDGAGVLGIYDFAGLNYRSLMCDNVTMIGGLAFTVNAENMDAPDNDGDYVVLRARNSGVGLEEVARIVGAAIPYVAFGGGQEHKFYENGIFEASQNIQLSANLDFTVDAKQINAPNTDGFYTLFEARDTGVGLVEVGRIVGAAIPYVAFGGGQQNRFLEDGTVEFGGNISMTGSINFISNAVNISAHNDDSDYLQFMARDNGVGMVEIARLQGAADPHFIAGNSHFYYSGYAFLGGDTDILTEKALQTQNADDLYYMLKARDNGAGRIEVARIAGAADPYFGIGVDGSVLKGTNSGLLGFFATAPVSQRLKANYNNWAAFGDVVDALVALGLFDAA